MLNCSITENQNELCTAITNTANISSWLHARAHNLKQYHKRGIVVVLNIIMGVIWSQAQDLFTHLFASTTQIVLQMEQTMGKMLPVSQSVPTYPWMWSSSRRWQSLQTSSLFYFCLDSTLESSVWSCSEGVQLHRSSHLAANRVSQRSDTTANTANYAT